MIRVEEVWKSYGGRAVLRGATLRGRKVTVRRDDGRGRR